MRRMNQCHQCYDHMLTLLHQTKNNRESGLRVSFLSKYEASGMGKITCQSCGREVEYTSDESGKWYEIGAREFISI